MFLSAMAMAINNRFSFDRFGIDPDRRLLLRDGEVVPIKAKTFDLLLALVEGRGAVLTKDELLDKVWEGQFVEENNLTVHIAALRKALGESKNERRYIVTIPGKGYRFVGDLAMTPSNGEVVVERKTLERVIVDETILQTTPTLGPSSIKWLALSLLIFGVGSATIAFYMIGPDKLRRVFAASAPLENHVVKQLTTNGKIGQAALSPDAKLFAYTVDDLGKKSLWLGYVDGGNHLLLREPSDAVYRGLTFSRDGKRLFFSLRDEKNPVASLFSLPVMGGALSKIGEGIASFALAPDETRFAAARVDAASGDYVVFTSAIDGSGAETIATFPAARAVRSDSISWSPDGRLLSASVRNEGEPYSEQTVVIDIEKKTSESVTHDGFREISETAWSSDGRGIFITAVRPDSRGSVVQYEVFHLAYPDGKTLAVTQDMSNYGASWMNDAGVSLNSSADGRAMLAVEHRMMANIWIAPADDLKAARQVTFSSFGKCDGLWGLDWLPDGRIVYTTSDTRSQVISIMSPDGSGQTPLTSTGYYDSVLTTAADGRYTFFHSNRGGLNDIWRMDADGGNMKQLTFVGQGYHPAPSIDGRWVYYLSILNNRSGLCRVPADGGEPECLNQNSTGWGSFSPDGRYYAAQMRTDKSRLAIFAADTGQLVRQFDLPKAGSLYMGSRWTPDSKAVAYRDLNVGYWMQPIDGGDPVRIDGLPEERLYNFAWSKDGKWFAFVRGHEIRDVVLLTSER